MMPNRLTTTPPSLEDFEAMAEWAYLKLPPAVRKACEGLVIRVEDFADEGLLVELGIEDPFELTGLFEGDPTTVKSVMDQPSQPNIVWLYRRPILDEWIERGNVGLEKVVTNVLVHEIAHHLGWSDEDIMAVDNWTL
ncbi:MAG: metallopeptidase family protein [Pseudomonadota bacterium]